MATGETKKKQEEEAKKNPVLDPVEQNKFKGLTKRRLKDEAEQAGVKDTSGLSTEQLKSAVSDPTTELKKGILAEREALGLTPESPEEPSTQEKFPGQELVTIEQRDEQGNVIQEQMPYQTAVAMGLYSGPPPSEIKAANRFAVGATALTLGGPIAWAVGGEVIAGGAGTAIRAGTAAKWASVSAKPLSSIKDFSLLLLSGKALDLGGVFTRKKDEQQQALNTLGQITSTIVGESTTGAGDWRKGIKELQNIETQLLELEQAMQEGRIRDVKLRVSGEIIDINADVYDQLATIREGVADIRTFAISGIQPELTPQEQQAVLRQLEQEGYIKPVDLTSARRKTNE